METIMVDHCPALPIVDTPRSVVDAAPVDVAKVARLRRLIASGDYVIDPERIAVAMLASDLAEDATT